MMADEIAKGIDLTDSAACEIRRIIADRGLDDSALWLRVGLKGGPGRSPRESYLLDLTETSDGNDATFNSHGIRIACYGEDLAQLEGTTIDFRDEGPLGPGFVFDVPPKVDATCGQADPNARPPTEEQVYTALRHVIDPEVGVNIVDLGLVYGLDIDQRDVAVTMTMTTPACPLSESIKADAAEQIRAASPGAASIKVQIVWEPRWGPEKMSDAAKQQLGWAR